MTELPDFDYYCEQYPSVATLACLHSYETITKWHGFFMITLAALAVGLNSEPQNIE